jgi:hypothetical protein
MVASSAGLHWQGPEAIVQVNYRPILSSEGVLNNKKPTITRQERKIWSLVPDGSPTLRNNVRLTVGRNLTKPVTVDTGMCNSEL